MLDYTIKTNQTGIHEALKKVVIKHRDHPFQAPISLTQQQAFQQFLHIIDERPIILDAGCGTGMSTEILTEQYPKHCVVGIDKSTHRLTRGKAKAHIIQADLIAFWQQCAKHNIHFEKIYLLYPNPWPKAKHLQRRFHGHGIFPTLLTLSSHIECRSNWLLYLEEMLFSCKLLGRKKAHITTSNHTPAISRFEAKYLANKNSVYKLLITEDNEI